METRNGPTTGCDSHNPRVIFLTRKSSYASDDATLFTANDSMMRVTPLMIILIPTSVPIAHTELVGQCT